MTLEGVFIDLNEGLHLTWPGLSGDQAVELLLVEDDLARGGLQGQCGQQGGPVTWYQCSPLPLVQLQRGSALIGREDHSVAGASNLMP